MSKHIAVAVGLVLGTSLLCAPAQAGGSVHWSVTVGTPGYYYTPPPPVVVYPQSQYIYGAPPAVYAPPAIYQPPAVVYIQPQPVYRVYPPPTVHYGSRGYPLREHKHGWHDRRDWHDRHDRHGGHHWRHSPHHR